MALKIFMQQLSSELIGIIRREKQVWEAMRNDGTPDRKRFLGILPISQMKINPKTQEEHALHIDKYVDILNKTNSYQFFIDNHNLAERMVYKEYINYSPRL